MAAAATAFLTLSTTFVASKLTEIMTMGLKFVWLLWIMEKMLAVAAAVDVVVVDAEETYLNRWKKTKLLPFGSQQAYNRISVSTMGGSFLLNYLVHYF